MCGVCVRRERERVYIEYMYVCICIYTVRERERERERERSEIHKRARRERERREGERMQRHSCALISVLLIHSFYRAILLPSGWNSARGCLQQNFEL